MQLKKKYPSHAQNTTGVSLLSCCYITVDYLVATTNPNADLFLAHTTAVATPFFLTTPVFPAIIGPTLHNV